MQKLIKLLLIFTILLNGSSVYAYSELGRQNYTDKYSTNDLVSDYKIVKLATRKVNSVSQLERKGDYVVIKSGFKLRTEYEDGKNSSLYTQYAVNVYDHIKVVLEDEKYTTTTSVPVVNKVTVYKDEVYYKDPKVVSYSEYNEVKKDGGKVWINEKQVPYTKTVYYFKGIFLKHRLETAYKTVKEYVVREKATRKVYAGTKDVVTYRTVKVEKTRPKTVYNYFQYIRNDHNVAKNNMFVIITDSTYKVIKQNPHQTLDLAGTLPIAGALFDSINVVFYYCEGDYGNAALSAVAIVVPFGASKALSGAISKSDELVDGTRVLTKEFDAVSDVLKYQDEINRVAKQLNNKELSTFVSRVYHSMEDFWYQNALKRGHGIDNFLGNNTSPSYRGIDYFDKGYGTAISRKSIDTGAITYTSTPSKFKSVLKKYVDELEGFVPPMYPTSQGYVIYESMIKSRVVELVLPDKKMTAAQLKIIDEITDYAKSKGIKMDYVVVKQGL